MGFPFDLSTSGIVAFLISTDRPAPRLARPQLAGFFQRLSWGGDHRVISAHPELIAGIAAFAETGLRTLATIPTRSDDEILDPEVSAELLRPLAEAMRRYDLYVLPVGSWQHTAALDDFAHQSARIPGYGVLVLIPDAYDPVRNIAVLDPTPGVAAAIRDRHRWPGAIFMLRTGESWFLPLDRAHAAVAELLDASIGPRYSSAQFQQLAQRVLADTSNVPDSSGQLVRLLHLSDLHFGTARAAELQNYLQANLAREIKNVDRVVITGDLFDQPRDHHFQQFRSFVRQLETLADNGKPPVVVPGNHDQRVFGNSLLGLGRRRRQLLDLDWHRYLVDDETRLVYFGFDSSRSGNLARGRVDAEQLRDRGTRLDADNTSGRLDGHLRIVLVHHHPYPYPTKHEPLIIDPRGWVGRESFVQLDGAEQLLRWCASRRVSLIMHGHKHIPRLITDDVAPHGNGRPQPITTVGCGSSLGAGGRDPSYNLIQWHPEQRSWSVDFRIGSADGGAFRSVALTAQTLAQSEE